MGDIIKLKEGVKEPKTFLTIKQRMDDGVLVYVFEGYFPAEDWGRIITDLALKVTQYNTQFDKKTAGEVLKKIKETFDKGLDDLVRMYD